MESQADEMFRHANVGTTINRNVITPEMRAAYEQTLREKEQLIEEIRRVKEELRKGSDDAVALRQEEQRLSNQLPAVPKQADAASTNTGSARVAWSASLEPGSMQVPSASGSRVTDPSAGTPEQVTPPAAKPRTQQRVSVLSPPLVKEISHNDRVISVESWDSRMALKEKPEQNLPVPSDEVPPSMEEHLPLPPIMDRDLPHPPVMHRDLPHPPVVHQDVPLPRTTHSSSQIECGMYEEPKMTSLDSWHWNEIPSPVEVEDFDNISETSLKVRRELHCEIAAMHAAIQRRVCLASAFIIFLLVMLIFY